MKTLTTLTTGKTNAANTAKGPATAKSANLARTGLRATAAAGCLLLATLGTTGCDKDKDCDKAAPAGAVVVAQSHPDDSVVGKGGRGGGKGGRGSGGHHSSGGGDDCDD
ncbi:hypothetical protein [Streptomyces physcomitrii]|uniref:Lipoprotein n=1 Tax=Streptomyces physcomitrii TaxID=2724184 RepID=A0ABX1H534_9ACTN|nr:hypothetical protein [Streptomyces physcomitrii]NKI43162.1 hypothetical protein [Streptomyces physcomitrii]